MRARSPFANLIFVLIDNVYTTEVDKGATAHTDCQVQGGSSRAVKLKIEKPTQIPSYVDDVTTTAGKHSASSYNALTKSAIYSVSIDR